MRLETARNLPRFWALKYIVQTTLSRRFISIFSLAKILAFIIRCSQREIIFPFNKFAKKFSSFLISNHFKWKFLGNLKRMLFETGFLTSQYSKLFYDYHHQQCVSVTDRHQTKWELIFYRALQAVGGNCLAKDRQHSNELG